MQLLLATHNEGKRSEIQSFLADLPITVVLPPNDFDVEETGETFEENAWLKAKGFADRFGMLTLADDSGLVVDALHGRPGVYSKRYGTNDAERCQKLLIEMDAKEHRSAHFVCVMCLSGKGVQHCVEGNVFGSIALAQEGSMGFGFDPIFIPEGYQETFATLGPQIKNELSHRRRAMDQIREILEKMQNDQYFNTQ